MPIYAVQLGVQPVDGLSMELARYNVAKSVIGLVVWHNWTVRWTND